MLKPCSYCNGPGRTAQEPRGTWEVWCLNGRCICPHGTGYRTEEEAIAAWNTRPVEDALRATVDRLHALRPAAEYREDMGYVLWWWLPIWKGAPWPEIGTRDKFSARLCPPTHFSPLPTRELLTASDGAEVSE